MGEQPPANAEHLAAWLHERLAEDDRLFELGIGVRIAGEQVHLTGVVANEERRATVGDAVATLVPHLQVRNEVTVAKYSEPDAAEQLS